MWIVMAVLDEMESGHSSPFPWLKGALIAKFQDDESGMCGVIPVFRTKKAAVKWSAGRYEIMQIREVKK